MPFTDIVEACVPVRGSIEEPDSVSGGLHEVDNKSRDAPTPSLNGQLGHDEVRRSNLLPEELAADLAATRPFQCHRQLRQ